MTPEEIKDIQTVLDNAKKLQAELDERNRCLEFLFNEYKTNKRWFREEPGKVTAEDIIKAAFDFGWSSRHNFDYSNK